MPEDTTSGSEFQRAVEEAKAEQSSTTTEPSASGASTEPDATTTPSNEPPAAASTNTTADAQNPDTDLISDTEYQALKDKHKDNPDELAKELRGVFTKKTQALAEQRKNLERLTGYSKFIDALEGAQTPEARAQVLTQAAKELGVDLSAVASPAAATEPAATTAASIADTAREKLTAAGLDFVAEPLTEILEAALQPLRDEIKSLSSVKTTADTLLESQAKAEVETTLKAFTEKYPDWRQHEPAMTELGRRILPGEGVSAIDHLAHLYRLVTYDAQVAAGVKQSIERMRKGAETTERLMPSVRETQVTQTAPAGDGSVRSFFEEAKREAAVR